MSGVLSIGVSGEFPFISLFDDTLREQFRAETSHSACNCRVVRVPFCDSSHRVLATSRYYKPCHIDVFDLETKSHISVCVGHSDSVYGLTVIPSTLSSNPLIVSGEDEDRQVLVFDAMEGARLCSLPEPPIVYRAFHAPEWGSQIVFIGGSISKSHQPRFPSENNWLCRYDLEKLEKVGIYGNEKSAEVWGLDGCIARNLLISASANHYGDNYRFRRTGRLRLWPCDDSGVCVMEVPLRVGAYGCCVIDDFVVVGSADGAILVFDLRKLESPVSVNRVFSGLVFEVSQIDEIRMAGVSADQCVRIWELSSGEVCESRKLGKTLFGLCIFGRTAAQELEIEKERVRYLLEDRHGTLFVRLYSVCGWRVLIPKFILPGQFVPPCFV